MGQGSKKEPKFFGSFYVEFSIRYYIDNLIFVNLNIGLNIGIKSVGDFYIFFFGENKLADNACNNQK